VTTATNQMPIATPNVQISMTHRRTKIGIARMIRKNAFSRLYRAAGLGDEHADRVRGMLAADPAKPSVHDRRLGFGRVADH
jgi:hypothetical protein